MLPQVGRFPRVRVPRPPWVSPSFILSPPPKARTVHAPGADFLSPVFRSVFPGRALGLRLALRLHLRLLPEGASPENLASLGEEGRLGRILQSGSHWYQTSFSSGNILYCHGFLCPLYKMNPTASDGQLFK
ncbi:hypothetical protein L345_04009, partial [Ophiophagus hannah]